MSHTWGRPAAEPGAGWAVVDVETSGFRPGQARVVSVAALAVGDDGNVGITRVSTGTSGTGDGDACNPVAAGGRNHWNPVGGASANTCGAGAGDGIEPGAMSWVTLHLAPGRYELVCNLPGHYEAGMAGPVSSE